MDLTDLLNGIGCNGELQERVLSATNELPPLGDIVGRLCRYERAEQANNELQELLGDDRDGMKMLAAHLKAALCTHDAYERLGIGDEIFFATMGCFPRFVGESMKHTGRLAFDRAWWTYRQLSCRLFRIGELEYERTENDRIYIHIPSDCDLREEQTERSFAQAKAFFLRFFPKMDIERFYCTSWLLSPVLQTLLGEGSNIKAFARKFESVEFLPDETGFYFWLFGKPPCPPEELPQNTALQRSVTQLLKEGKTLGAGAGYLDLRSR